jgi:oligopeptide/dipeptide ABC transporter ATP-binding protein
VNPPSGCRFRTRCWKAQDICASEVPELVERPGTDHPSACHFAEKREIVVTHEAGAV